MIKHYLTLDHAENALTNYHWVQMGTFKWKSADGLLIATIHKTGLHEVVAVAVVIK